MAYEGGARMRNRSMGSRLRKEDHQYEILREVERTRPCRLSELIRIVA
jgi:hypothetical protein